MDIKNMTFEQFTEWATGLLIIRLGSGQPVKSTMWEILNNFLINWIPNHKKTLESLRRHDS